MKRFYCTVCQRIKRVRKMPKSIQSVDSIDPSMRVGQCNRHSILHSKSELKRHHHQKVGA